jgi:hypothetical protein
MNDVMSPSGEGSNHKLAAVFHDPSQARRAERMLDRSAQLGETELDILGPDTRRPGRRLLPESGGIWRTGLKAHAVLGAAGAMTGMLAFLSLYLSGVQVVTDNPLLSGLVLLHVPTMMGLLLGGLFTLRPDQSAYLYAARDALRSGKAVLLVHARTKAQLDAARELLEEPAIRTVTTI